MAGNADIAPHGSRFSAATSTPFHPPNWSPLSPTDHSVLVIILIAATAPAVVGSAESEGMFAKHYSPLQPPHGHPTYETCGKKLKKSYMHVVGYKCSPQGVPRTQPDDLDYGDNTENAEVRVTFSVKSHP